MPNDPQAQKVVLAVDPGRDKCGLAVVLPHGIMFRAVIPTSEVGLTCRYLLAQHAGAQVIVGGATCSRQVVAAIVHDNEVGEPVVVAEENSTLEARRRYFEDNPPKWWQRLVPQGMRVPPRAVDDYAAVVLAERYLAGEQV
ncbi:MAG: hypothetical protein ABFE08_12140 [Armatimonadia bacterium]